jgi:hypothetical protein
MPDLSSGQRSSTVRHNGAIGVAPVDLAIGPADTTESAVWSVFPVVGMAPVPDGP